MADEIRVTTGITLINGALKVQSPTRNVKYDQATAAAGNPGTVTVGTSEETIGFGDLVPGWVSITNLDDTNFVDLGFSTGVYGMTIPADSTVVFKMKAAATLFVLSDTADVDLQVIGFSD